MYIEPWLFWTILVVLGWFIFATNRWSANCAKEINKMADDINDLRSKYDNQSNLIAKIMANQTVDEIIEDEDEDDD